MEYIYNIYNIIYIIYIILYIIYIYIIYTHKNMFGDGGPCDKHFQIPGHNFNTEAKFTIIEEVYNKSLLKLKIRSLLEHREDFWSLKLQTLSPQGLNISLNYPQETTGSIW